MIKVVLDSNVYISGILFHGKPRDLLDRAVRGSIAVYISPAILEEVKDVLGRAKFGFPPARIAAIAGEIESIAIQVVPERKYSVVPRDSDDTIVIDCAMESKADFIVTGDNDLLSMGHYEGIQIVSHADFLRMQNER